MSEAEKTPYQHEVLKQTALHLNTASDIVGNNAGIGAPCVPSPPPPPPHLPPLPQVLGQWVWKGVSLVGGCLRRCWGVGVAFENALKDACICCTCPSVSFVTSHWVYGVPVNVVRMWMRRGRGKGSLGVPCPCPQDEDDQGERGWVGVEGGGWVWLGAHPGWLQPRLQGNRQPCMDGIVHPVSLPEPKPIPMPQCNEKTK